MNIQRVASKSAALALICSLALPNPALALRTTTPQEAGTEAQLRAGMEESSFERRINDRLESLRMETQQRLGAGVNVEWHSSLPKEKVKALANAFLNYSDPGSVKRDVDVLMARINQQVLQPLREVAPGILSPGMEELRELALILPVADDWLVLAYSPPALKPGEYKRRTRALAIYSRRAAALAWGRNGPHLRANFVPADQEDVRLGSILLRVFLPETRRLLGRVQQKGWKKAGDRLKRRAEEYAGLLFNGLIIPDRDAARRPFKAYTHSFDGWMAESNGRLRPAIRLAVSVFPEKFPLKPVRMPGYLRFANEQFAHQEIAHIREFNRSRPGSPLTLWQLTAGTGATEEYILYLNIGGPVPLSRRPRLMERVYGHVLRQADVVPGLAAGMEEKYEWADIDEIQGLRKRLEDADRLDEYETRLIKKGGRYYLVKSPQLLGSHNKRAVWNDINRASREYAAFLIARALKCNVCDVIVPDDKERVGIASLLKWQIEPAGLYLVEMSTNYSLRGDSRVMQTDPKKEFTRRLVAAFLMRMWDLHHNNTGPLKDSHEVRMMFDLDQAFHRSMDSFKAYLLEFAINFDSPGSLDAGTVSTVDRAKRAGGVYEVDSLHVFEAIDPAELKEAFKDAKRLDLGKLKEVDGRKLVERHQKSPQWPEMKADWEIAFGHVKNWQRDLHKDFPKFLHALTETTDYPKSKRKVVHKIQPAEAAQLQSLYEKARAAVAAAQAELRLDRRQDAGVEEKIEILPYRATIDITNILRGLEKEDERFDGQVSEILLKALAAARAEKRKARVLIVGAGAGAILYDVKQLLGDAPDVEVVFINKQQVELNKWADLAAGTFADEVILNRKLVDFKKALQEARQFLREFRRDGVIRDVNEGFPPDDERFRDGSFDVVMVTTATLPYIQRKAPLFREIERVLRVGGTAFISTAHGFLIDEMPAEIFFSLLPDNLYEYARGDLRIDKRKEGISFPSLPRVSYIQGPVFPGIPPEFDSVYVSPSEISKAYTWLQEEMAHAAAAAESADLENERRVVVVDDSAFAKSPRLLLLLAKLDRLAPRVIVFGSALVTVPLTTGNTRSVFALNELVLREELEAFRSRGVIDGVVFLGAPARQTIVEQMAKTLNLAFVPAPPSVAALLAGLGVPAHLAAELTADMEEAQLLEVGT